MKVAANVVPGSDVGVNVTLQATEIVPVVGSAGQTAGIGTFCGGSLCNGKILFISPLEGYTNPKAPARIHITWDKTVAGKGTKSKIYLQKAPDGPITVVPKCKTTSSHVAIPSPCIHTAEKISGGDIRFEIPMVSGDPRFARR